MTLLKMTLLKCSTQVLLFYLVLHFSGSVILSGAELLRYCCSIWLCTSQVSLFYQILPCHSFSMQGRQERKNRMP